MSKIVLFNQKGGVAKTTTSINLAAALSYKGYKTLLVDLDPQANSTIGVGIDDEALDKTIHDLIIHKGKITRHLVESHIIKTDYDNLELLPSNIELSDAELYLVSVMNRESVLKKILQTIDDQYDYIIIDAPPSLGLLSINALVASDHLIIPVSTSYFASKGIKQLLETYRIVKENINEELDIMGVLITKYDVRKNIAKDIRTTLSEVFGNKLFTTLIRVNSQIEYSQDKQTPIIYFDQKCNGFQDYIALAEEVLHYGK